jgi:nucleotide-binding universal stress UspA family protein
MAVWRGPRATANLRGKDEERVIEMRGTIVCGVTDTDEGREALATAVEVGERLGLRLVLAHVAEGIAVSNGHADGGESVTMKGDREGATRLLARLVDEYDVAERAECRVAVGDTGSLLGQIAAEEAADLIVVGARARGRLRRGLESRLAERLETETPVPVLIAPPRLRQRRKAMAIDAARR